MNMQRSPNRWSCLLTSFAMALDVTFESLAQKIGHEGDEIIFPNLPDPLRRRAFHIQEFVVPSLNEGFALVIVEARPVIAVPVNGQHLFKPLDLAVSRLNQFTTMYDGVLIGMVNRQPHAVAWNSLAKACYDPSTEEIYSMDDFAIREFAALIPLTIKSQ